MGRPAGRPVSEAQILAIAATRYCNYCGTTLVRREDEKVHGWLKRRNCNRECGMKGRPPRPSGIRRGPSETAPIKTTPPARDQCWAGFKVGRRCVLDRGSHVTHRDEAGHEFVRVEPRPIERTARHVPSDSFAEHLSIRNDWRSATGRYSS